MNFKVLALILLYYGTISTMFFMSQDTLTDAGASSNVQLSEVSLSASEIDSAGITNVGSTIGKFFGFLAFGVGLPSDTPIWFSFLFSLWSIFMVFFVIGFIYQAVRAS